MTRRGGVALHCAIAEPEVDKAASDEQYEYWNGVVEKLKEFRLAGQWAEMEPYILVCLNPRVRGRQTDGVRQGHRVSLRISPPYPVPLNDIRCCRAGSQ